MTTPDINAPHVVAFCATISKEKPVLIPVKPMADLQTDDCFNNLDAVVIRHGGSAVSGWTLYEWRDVFIEAEFHHTWRKKTGQLEDPTPRRDGFRTIAFLPDPTVPSDQFPGVQRKVLVDDPMVFQYLRAMDAEGGGAAVHESGPSKIIHQLKRSIEAKYRAVDR